MKILDNLKNFAIDNNQLIFLYEKNEQNNT